MISKNIKFYATSSHPHIFWNYKIPREDELILKYPNKWCMECDYWLKTIKCPFCQSKLEKETKDVRECHECKACNLGVFSSHCECEYYTQNNMFHIL